MIYDVATSKDTLSAITANWGGFDKAFRIRPGPVAFQVKGPVTGPTSVEVALQFASVNGSVDPVATTDADWMPLVSTAGVILTNVDGTTGQATGGAVSFVAATGNALHDCASRVVVNDGTVQWNGHIPSHVGWVRVRLKRTGGGAVTALTLRMLVDGSPTVVTGA